MPFSKVILQAVEDFETQNVLPCAEKLCNKSAVLKKMLARYRHIRAIVRKGTKEENDLNNFLPTGYTNTLG